MNNKEHTTQAIRNITDVNNISSLLDLEATDLIQNLLENILSHSNDTPNTAATDTHYHQSLALLQSLVTQYPDKYYSLVFNELYRFVIDNNVEELNSNLVDLLIKELASESVSVSSTVSNTILALNPSTVIERVHALFDSSSNSVVSVRCAALIMSMSLKTDISKGHLQQIVLEMLSNETDPLLQISVMDQLEQNLLDELCNGGSIEMSKQLLTWFLSDPILSPILTLAGGGLSPKPDPILGANALRFLSKICQAVHLSGAADLNTSVLLKGFQNALHVTDIHYETDRLAFIDAASSFAAVSSNAFHIILEDDILTDKWLNMSSVQPRMKAVIIESAARIFLSSNSSSFVPSKKEVVELWENIGMANKVDSLTAFIFNLAKSPLLELKVACYHLMNGYARSGTGAQVLLSYPGILEYLLNRETEDSKEGKEAKFGIVESILESDAKGLLAIDIISRLEKVRKQGAYYKDAQRWDVAVE